MLDLERQIVSLFKDKKAHTIYSVIAALYVRNQVVHDHVLIFTVMEGLVEKNILKRFCQDLNAYALKQKSWFCCICGKDTEISEDYCSVCETILKQYKGSDSDVE